MFSALYSNAFLVRAFSKENQFRLSLGIGYSDGTGIPVIITQATVFAQEAVWQRLDLPLGREYEGEPLQIFGRISDTKWGTRGPVNFSLKEGNSMIYSQSASVGNEPDKGPLVERFGSVLDVKVEGSQGVYSFPPSPGRESGFIRSQYGAPVWIYFSADVDPARPFSAQVPAGGSIEFPPGYEGSWSVDPGQEEVSDSPSISYVEYTRTVI